MTDPLYALNAEDLAVIKEVVRAYRGGELIPPSMRQRRRLDIGVGRKKLFRFLLDASLGTSQATGTGVITHQYGVGVAQSTTGTVTLINLAIDGGYLFSGSSGAAGLAYYGSSTGSPILQMECPTS